MIKKAKTKIWALLIVFLVFIPVNGISSNSIGLWPKNYDENNLITKSWFIKSVKPGETTEDSLIVYNYFEEDKTVEVVAKDAYETNEGGFSYLENNEENTEVGKWVELEKNEINIKKQAGDSVKFKITVPADAESGEYAGVIASSLKENFNNNSGVTLVNRLGTRLYVTVPGDLKNEVEIQELKIISPDLPNFDTWLVKYPALSEGNTHILLKLKNTGNIFSRISGKITLNQDQNLTFPIDINLSPRKTEVELVIPTSTPLTVGALKLNAQLNTEPFIAFNKPEGLGKLITEESETIIEESSLDKIKKLNSNQSEETSSASKGSFTINPQNKESENMLLGISQNLNLLNSNNSTTLTLIILVLSCLVLLGVCAFLLYKILKKKLKK